MQLESMYQDVILDHYRHPHHRGLQESYDAQVHHVNPTCGDEVTVRVRLGSAPAAAGAGTPPAGEPSAGEPSAGEPSAGEPSVQPAVADPVVDEVSFEGIGCSISQASASVMADLVTGRTLREAFAVYDEFVELMRSKGEGTPDEELLDDAVAFTGVSRYPARIKCALLGWMAFKDAAAQAVAVKERL
jgi:nitrogen fixation protein NifU and related proteins